jgi:hypothetical protein
VTISAKLGCGFQRGLAVLGDVPYEILRCDEIDLAGVQQLCRLLMVAIGKSRFQPQDFSGMGNFKNDHLSLL